MDQEITLDSLRKMAERAGLKLSEDELQGLLPGVNRSNKQAREVRELVGAGNEPASTFDLVRAYAKTDAS